MSEPISSFSDERYWDDKIATNAEQFHEADRLDVEAYKLIQDDRSPEAWARFTEAKTKADAKRAAAFQEWVRLKRMMTKEVSD